MLAQTVTTSKVVDVKYVTGTTVNGVQVDEMRFTLADGTAVYARNGGYHEDNPALCTLAALGGRPSDLEAAEGATLAYVFDETDTARPPKVVVSNGREVLKRADWFVPDTADDDYIEVE